MSRELGKRIALELEKKGITQRELAVRITLDEATISRYISGTREPKPEILANIATALNTTADYLLGIESEEFDYRGIKQALGRNASKISLDQKKELINALLGEDKD